MGLRVRPPSAGQGKAKPSRAQEQTPPNPVGGQGPPPSPLISACFLTVERGQCAQFHEECEDCTARPSLAWGLPRGGSLPGGGDCVEGGLGVGELRALYD